MYINIDNKNNNFDLLRIFAALLVIFSHSFALSGFVEPKVPFTTGSYGGLGVKIFFLISGFLITMSFLRRKDFFKYIYARCLRIFPGLITVVILTVFVLGPLVTNLSKIEYFSNPQTYKYFKMITLFTDPLQLPGVFNKNVYPAVNGSLWTLQYEFMLYLIIGVIGTIGLFKIKNMPIYLYLITIFIGSQTADLPKYFIFHSLNFNIFIDFSIYFILGACFYIYRDKINLNISSAIFCTLILLYFSFFGKGLSSGLISIIIGYLVFFLAFYFDIAKYKKLIKLNLLGDVSYGLYIYAFPIQELVTHLFGGGNMKPSYNFFISVPLTIIMAFISWNFIEKKFLELKK